MKFCVQTVERIVVQLHCLPKVEFIILYLNNENLYL